MQGMQELARVMWHHMERAVTVAEIHLRTILTILPLFLTHFICFVMSITASLLAINWIQHESRFQKSNNLHFFFFFFGIIWSKQSLDAVNFCSRQTSVCQRHRFSPAEHQLIWSSIVLLHSNTNRDWIVSQTLVRHECTSADNTSVLWMISHVAHT